MATKTQTGPARGFARGLAQRLTFLPDPVREFLYRRGLEVFGLVLITAAAALAKAQKAENAALAAAAPDTPQSPSS